jgi:hypothetical protein
MSTNNDFDIVSMTSSNSIPDIDKVVKKEDQQDTETQMPPEASLDEKVTRHLSVIGYSSDEAKEIARKVVECIEKYESDASASKSGSDEGFASSNKSSSKDSDTKDRDQSKSSSKRKLDPLLRKSKSFVKLLDGNSKAECFFYGAMVGFVLSAWMVPSTNLDCNQRIGRWYFNLLSQRLCESITVLT